MRPWESLDQRDGRNGREFETSSLLRFFKFSFNSVRDFFPGSSLLRPKLQQSILNNSFVNVLGFGFVLIYPIELETEGWGSGVVFFNKQNRSLFVCLFVR